MSARLRSLTAEDFATLPACRKVVVHDNAVRYAELLVDDGREPYAVAWPSEGVEPIVRSVGGQTWLGVDQRVACIDTHGRVAFAIAVVGSLVAIKTLGTCVAILSDAVLLLVNADFSVRQIVVLENLPSDVVMERGRIVVVGLDGDRLDAGAA